MYHRASFGQVLTNPTFLLLFDEMGASLIEFVSRTSQQIRDFECSFLSMIGTLPCKASRIGIEIKIKLVSGQQISLECQILVKTGFKRVQNDYCLTTIAASMALSPPSILQNNLEVPLVVARFLKSVDAKFHQLSYYGLVGHSW